MIKLFNQWFKPRWLIAAVFFTGLVICFSHIPQDNLGQQTVLLQIDKILHVTAYGIITFLAISSVKFRPYFRIKLIVFILVISIGYLDEYYQSFVGRTSSIVDWLADISGVVLGLIVFEVKYHLKLLQSGPVWD